MKLNELIDKLQELAADTDGKDPDVHFAYNYGDHCQTQVAPAVSEVSEGKITPSGYHRMPRVYDEDEAEKDAERNRPANKKIIEVIIIS